MRGGRSPPSPRRSVAAPASAHIVYAGATLLQLVANAEVVARARIAGSDELWVVPLALRRPVVDAELLEVWKGGLPPGRVRFAQHGHGVAPFEPGEEVVVFLGTARRSRELELLASSGALDWVSLQEHDDEWSLDPPSREVVASAVQGYTALERVTDPARRVAGLHQLTLELLASDEPRLSTSALQDLVRAGDAPAAHARRPARARPAARRHAPADRAARRHPGRARAPRSRATAMLRWVRLVDTARAADLPAAVRAAGAHPGPAVTARLVRVLEADAGAAAEAAAVALGTPGNVGRGRSRWRGRSAGGDARLRMAAIRGLGRIGLPAARAALSEAASGHPDAATRRRATAELRVLAAGGTG